MDLPDVETIIERCNQSQRWDEDRPPFGGFILEENLDGGWRKDLRNKRFIVTDLVLSALVGLLIPVFAGSEVYGAKVIAKSTTKRIVAAERQSRKKEREDNWNNVNTLKNITEKLTANKNLLQNMITLNKEIQLLERESRNIMSRSIWLHKKGKKGDFQWDPRDPHTEVFSEITSTNVMKSIHGLNPAL